MREYGLTHDQKKDLIQPITFGRTRQNCIKSGVGNAGLAPERGECRKSHMAKPTIEDAIVDIWRVMDEARLTKEQMTMVVRPAFFARITAMMQNAPK